MSSTDRVLSEYEGILQQLRAWPDKRIIFDVTDICARSGHIANDLADILISRLIDPQTNVALKVPLFYLVDSIVKNVGGPYIDLFSSHIVVTFQRIFAEVNDMDKARLDFLLSTWEEGKFFHRDMLWQMRKFIGRRVVCIKPQHHHKLQQQQQPSPSNFRPQGRGPPSHNRFHPQQQQQGMSIRAPMDSGRPFSRGSGGASPSTPSSAKDQMKAFIAETVVTVNMTQAQHVNGALLEWSDIAAKPESDRDPQLLELRAASTRVAKRLNGFLSSLNAAPKLPPMLFDTFVNDPNLQPTAHPAGPTTTSISRFTDQTPGSSGSDRSKNIKRTMPPFNVDELKRNPQKALRPLYTDRPFYSHQDGLRFKSQQVLGAHLDALFVQNKEKRSREQSQSGMTAGRSSRQWYLDATQWVTDCGALGGAAAVDMKSEASGTGGANSSGNTTSTTPEVDEDEEMVVPADENFARCPVSNEVFQTVWDDEEGDFMYRNAVKVLLTEEADSELYSVSQNTHQPGVRYALVHKRMALDGWLASGKAVSLKDAMDMRRKQTSGPQLLADYAKAGNVDEDEDDMFVVLPSKDIGESMELSENNTVVDEETGADESESKMELDTNGDVPASNNAVEAEAKE